MAIYTERMSTHIVWRKGTSSARLTTFGMQILMVEAELSRLESDGLDLGHARTLSTNQVVDVELFEADILRQARKMADFYVIYYSLENQIRRLIRGGLHAVG